MNKTQILAQIKHFERLLAGSRAALAEHVQGVADLRNFSTKSASLIIRVNDDADNWETINISGTEVRWFDIYDALPALGAYLAYGIHEDKEFSKTDCVAQLQKGLNIDVPDEGDE